jgi:hypothetical protein
MTTNKAYAEAQQEDVPVGIASALFGTQRDIIVDCWELQETQHSEGKKSAQQCLVIFLHLREFLVHEKLPGQIKGILFGKALVLVHGGHIWDFLSQLRIGNTPVVTEGGQHVR